jgi:hypothetical protein
VAEFVYLFDISNMEHVRPTGPLRNASADERHGPLDQTAHFTGEVYALEKCQNNGHCRRFESGS